MQALGFNTIKLPFSFESLLGSSSGTYARGCTPASDKAIIDGLTESRVTVADGATFPSVTATGASYCNSEIPDQRVGDLPGPMARFNWVIQYFAANGFYVVCFLLACSDRSGSCTLAWHTAAAPDLGCMW